MKLSVRPTICLGILALVACAKNPAAPPRMPGAEWTEESGDPTHLALESLVAIRAHCEPFEGFRQFRSRRTDTSDADLLRELGLRAWSVAVEPGPIRTWIRVEETGQSTTLGQAPEGLVYTGAAPGGRLTLWFLPGANGRMASARAKGIVAAIGGVGREPRPVPQGFGVQLAGGTDHRELSVYPPAPLFWADWDDVRLTASVRAGIVSIEGETTLATIEAIEPVAREGQAPRRVVLRWYADVAAAPAPPK